MQRYLHRVESLLAKREVKKAEVIIARCLRSDIAPADRAKFLVYRARVRLLSARPDDAISDLLAVRSTMPVAFETAPVLELLADCYFARFELASVGFADRSDTTKALKLYQSITSDYPAYDNLGWVYYQMGRVYLTENIVQQAIECFRQTLFAPSHVNALTAYCYERLGFIAFYEQRDLPRALGYLNKVLDTYPATAERLWLVQVHLLRSRVLREIGDYDRALKAAETALTVAAGNSGENKTVLAEVLLTNGELLAQIEGREKDMVACLLQFLQVSKRPLGVDVTWSRVHEMLGDAYFRLGQFENAVTAYDGALQFNPYHPWEVSLHYRIARCYYHDQAYNAAVAAIERMLYAAKADGQTIQDFRVYDILGSAHFALGNYEAASAAYQSALNMVPPHAEQLERIKQYYQFALDSTKQPS